MQKLICTNKRHDAVRFVMTKCPVCRMKIEVKDGKIVSHGPGRGTFFCKGSGSASR